jgi:hypothetical protein
MTSIDVTKYDVYYMQPESFREFIFGDKVPTVADLADTHTKLMSLEMVNPEAVWTHMQAENWSPNGEARSLIEEKGLSHTSMSVGDVIHDIDRNLYYVVKPVGFFIIV